MFLAQVRKNSENIPSFYISLFVFILDSLGERWTQSKKRFLITYLFIKFIIIRLSETKFILFKFFLT